MASDGGGHQRQDRRTIVYCIVPRDLASKLHEPLRRHFRDDASVEVVVERRTDERRGSADRRSAESRAAGADRPERERRRVRHPGGRRVGERRAALVAADPLPLPRRAHRYADRLVFVEAVAPSEARVEDEDTTRLVASVQGGDRAAFGTLYTRYFDRVYGYLRVALGDAHEAEDATQQVFLKVFEALPGYEQRGQPFRGWLFVVVRNEAITTLRRRGRLEPVEPAELSRRSTSAAEDQVPELSSLDWVSDKDLLMLLERLPLAQRQVILLRYMLDLSHAQIAQALDRNPEQVRALLHRALTFFRQRLTALGRSAPDRSRHRMLRRPSQAYAIRRRRFALLD